MSSQGPNNSRNGGGAKKGATELDQHLEKEHAMCGFCKRWFFDSDGLYKHCRDHHEECFICMKLGIRHQYHLNYDRLVSARPPQGLKNLTRSDRGSRRRSQEQHFKSDHYLCPHPDCLAQKFVVFESELDLQAHALDVHGVGSVDQKARKEARRIETRFTYSTGESSRGSSGGGGGNNHEGGGGGGRRRPGGRAPVASFVEPVREDPVATPRGERRIPGLGALQALGSGSSFGGQSSGAGSSRAARFGGQLTPDVVGGGGRSGASTPVGGEPDSATLERHAALLRRVQDATHGHDGKLAGFKLAARSYRAGELSARDFCDQMWHILDQRVDEAEAVVLGFADLLEDEDKRRALQQAWRAMSNEVRLAGVNLHQSEADFDLFLPPPPPLARRAPAEPVPVADRARAYAERHPDPTEQHVPARPLGAAPQRSEPLFDVGPRRGSRAVERARARRAAVEPVPGAGECEQREADSGVEQGGLAEEARGDGGGRERDGVVQRGGRRRDAQFVDRWGGSQSPDGGVPFPRRRRRVLLVRFLLRADQPRLVLLPARVLHLHRGRAPPRRRPRLPLPPGLDLRSGPTRAHACGAGETGGEDRVG